MRETVGAYLSADEVWAVGGGYLGDRYQRESLLTCWTWWWATRLGAKVRTMPISIEGTSAVLHRAYQLSLSRVGVTVRDSSSSKLLEKLNIEHNLVPDLAFRNVSPSTGRDRRGLVAICPVGGDYFSERVWKSQLDMLAETLRLDERLLAGRFVVVPMHRSLGTGIAGFDAEACDYLLQCGSGGERAPAEWLESYSALCLGLRENVDLVVSARMHGGIAGLCASTRVVLLGYEEKHRSLMQDLGLQRFYDEFGSADTDRLRELVSSAMDTPLEEFERAAARHTARLTAWTASL
jgi:polysaccharide pyruvyl transferase WcaK-like protein